MSESFRNYFNYFTEIEEHFQRARGTSLFLLSPLDWALIESWKGAGLPLEAVLRGIDASFEKWRAKRSRHQMVNSLAFCAQAVMQEAQRMADGGAAAGTEELKDARPFPDDEIRRYLSENAALIRGTNDVDYAVVATALDGILAELPAAAQDLEALEQRLTVLEQKLVALARAKQSEEKALETRRELDSHLRPYRSRMSAPQLAMLESQYLERAALEAAALPRLSLFYLK